MGGDSYCSSLPSTGNHSTTRPSPPGHRQMFLFPDDVSLSSQDESSDSSGHEESVSHGLGNPSVIKGARVSDSGEFPRVTSSAAEKQKLKVYKDALRSYQDLQPRIDRLEEAKKKILSYTPGSWADNAARTDLKDVILLRATSLLLIGPKASGKSSLVNKISQILEDCMFLPPRSPVSGSSSPEDGTYFLHEYTIPKNSGRLNLYDTRGLSLDSSENLETIERWMRKGVSHGELITRRSDSIPFQTQLRRRARRTFLNFGLTAKPVDFVVFVVNGLSVLESMDNADEAKKGYSQMIAANFNHPTLLFKDDKPAVVVTHGDLMSLSDRARVCSFLGELLGVPPVGQIFDIPEDNDPATALAVFDMLIYCLDRADRNCRPDLFLQVLDSLLVFMYILLGFMVLVFVINSVRILDKYFG